MKFYDVAHSFNEIEKTASRLSITELLAQLLGQASSHEAGIICYMSLGELYPPYIASQFNLAEKLIVPIVAKLLEQSASAIVKEAKRTGDIGTVVETGTWQKKGDALTVDEVYDRLVSLKDIMGTGSQEARAAALYRLLSELDPLSAKYVIRIVLGKLRLGFSDMTIVDALSWMEASDKSLRPVIEDAYNVSVDIGLIAQTLKRDGIDALKKMSVTVGVPIRPAAAERLPTASEIIAKIGPCVAQPKLDGFRLQIHLDKTRKKPIIRFFSRNLKDMSAMFPDLIEALHAVDAKTIICEGEAIGYDPDTHQFLPFQETVKRKRKHAIETVASEFPLKLFLFDILYLNGKSLLNEIHEKRYRLLQGLIKSSTSSVLQLIQERHIKTAQELENYFLETVGEGLEGLVVKRMDAVYQPGKRNFNWIKLKRQEEGHVEDTIDCVVLGYYGGSGKRAQFGIGAFLVGIFNKKEDQFETIAKVGTGLTDAEWTDLKKKCDTRAVVHKPHQVVCAKELYPDVWVSPEIVCQIRADEITKSPLHTAGKKKDELGLALRFPRFMGYREDKNPEDATTVSELKTMFEHQKAR